MNLQPRHGLAWQMIGPIPLMVIAAIVAVWFIVPRKIADSATDQAVLAGEWQSGPMSALGHKRTFALQ